MEENIEFLPNPIIKVSNDNIIYANPMAKDFFSDCMQESNYSLKILLEKKFGNSIHEKIKKEIKEKKEEGLINIDENLLIIIRKNEDESYNIVFLDLSYLKLYKEIANTTSDIVIITKLNGEIIYINKSSLIILSGQKVLEKRINEIFEIDTHKILEETKKGKTYSFNTKYSNQNTIIYISFLVKIIELRNKKYFLFSGKNITELIEYQKILFDYLKNQTVIMESFEILIRNKDIKDIVENIEKKLKKDLNIESVEFIDSGKTIYSSQKTSYFYDINFSPSLYPEKKITFRIYFTDIKFLIENIHIKETLLYIFTNVFNTYEKIIFIEKLKEERDRALRSDKLKSSFLSNLSHEIRTPLNGILGFLQILETENIKLELQDYINTIKESSERLIRNIENILYLSKLETQDLKIKKQKVIIEEIISEITEKYMKLLSEKNIKLNIPDKAKQTLIYTDREKIKKIIAEIFDNAAKFTEKGGINIKVEKKQKEIEIIIEDTGVGIPDEVKKDIFEKFFQCSPKSFKKYYGLGIGLSIVKKLLEILGGEIYIENQKVGTRFTIRLKKGIY